jgi:hypothetical protein
MENEKIKQMLADNFTPRVKIQSTVQVTKKPNFNRWINFIANRKKK